MKTWICMDWRKEFKERIDYVADIMNEQLTKILLAPERNLMYRAGQKEELEKLTEAIQQIKDKAL